MKIQYWSIAVALALAGCGKEECRVVDPDAVVAAVEKEPTDEQKEALHKLLMDLVKVKDKGYPTQATAESTATTMASATATAWDEILGKELPLHYSNCSVSTADCHLSVAPAGSNVQGTPARWLRFEKNTDGTYWAGIRTSGTPKGYMICEELTAGANTLSGWCAVRPHQRSGKHWFEFAALMSATGIHESIYYKYFDSVPTATGADVHNGEGHGGSD